MPLEPSGSFFCDIPDVYPRYLDDISISIMVRQTVYLSKTDSAACLAPEKGTTMNNM